MFIEEPAIHVGAEVKIVWRMTGGGDLQLSVTAPDGTPAEPVFGPTAHASSNYDRPGDEWGAGYVFERPGCWTLHASRGGTKADVGLAIET